MSGLTITEYDTFEDVCPFTEQVEGNHEIVDGSSWDCDSMASWQRVTCTCGASWAEVYFAHHLQDVTPPNVEEIA